MMEPLHKGRTVALSVLAGLVAGGILAGVNAALVQPYTAMLAEIELDNLIADGEFDEEEYDAQIQSINLSQQYGSVAIGLAGGVLVGGLVLTASVILPLRQRLRRTQVRNEPGA